jgi:hypothetical protein
MIEETLQQLTAAIKDLTAALKSQPTVTTTVTETPAPAKAKKEKPAAAPAPEPVAEAPKAEPTPAAEPVKEAAPITLADLRAAAQKILDANAAKGTDGVAIIREINTRHGIKKISECPAEKFAAVLLDLQAAT